MLIVHNISNLVIVTDDALPRFGKQMNDIQVLEDGYIVVDNDRFIEIGVGNDYLKYKNAQLIDGSGKTITPGLIDCHTHLVHAGSRENEFTLKLQGASYLDILNNGGGIHSTVDKTRLASFDELYEKAKQSLDIMLSYGVTVVEAKSGYGLDFDTEIRQLEVSKKLNETHPIDIINTYMGAHAIPKEYKDKREEYIHLVKEMIAKVKCEDYAKFVDVFCEESVFTIDEAKDILEYAKTLGLGIKLHADEIADTNGALLASKLNCISAEHLLKSNEANLIKLVDSRVIAVMLPLTSFYLNSNFFSARYFVDSGGALAIATDYNPGSSPSENLQLAMQIASMKGSLTPKEVITATTINAACALNLSEDLGSISVGKLANFVIFNTPNLDYLIYHFGINHTGKVFIKGKEVYSAN
jgi:imidazolonepropionase